VAIPPLHKRILPILASAIALFALSFFSNAQAASLAEADRVIQICNGKLSCLLNQKDLLERYYQALRLYYGPDFKRSTFDSINALLKRTLVKHPEMESELSQRLFSPGAGQAYTIHVDYPDSGLELNHETWKKYLQSLKARLKTEAAEVDRAHATRVGKQVSGQLTDETRKISELEGISKKSRRELISRAYQAFQANPEVKKISSFVTLELLQSPGIEKQLASGDANVVLALFDHLRNNPRLLIEQVLGADTLPSVFSSSVRQMLPSKEQLIQNSAASPRMIRTFDDRSIPVGSAPAGEYRMVPPSRKIHAIYAGDLYNDCLGSDCTLDVFGGKKRPNLERILTTVLDGAEIHFVEVNGRPPDGFVKSVPVRRQNQVVGSTEFLSRTFSHTFVQNAADSPTRKGSANFVELWLSEAMKHKPKNWEGFAMSGWAAASFNNTNAAEIVQQAPSYIFGKNLGLANSFRIDDPLAKTVPNLYPRRYGSLILGKMVVESQVPYAGSLTMFKPADAGTVEKILSDPDQIEKWLAETTNPPAKAGLAHLVGQTRSADPRVQSVLLQALVVDPIPVVTYKGEISFQTTAMEALQKMPIDNSRIAEELARGLTENLHEATLERLQALSVHVLKKNGGLSQPFLKLLTHPSQKIRNGAAKVIAQGLEGVASPGVLSSLKALIGNPSKSVSNLAFSMLSDLKTRDPLVLQSLLEHLLKEPKLLDPPPAMRGRVYSVLGQAKEFLTTNPTKDLQSVFDQIPVGTKRKLSLLAVKDNQVSGSVELEESPPKELVSESSPFSEPESEFLANEQRLHTKSGARFRVPLPKEWLPENSPVFKLGYYLVPDEASHFLRSTGANDDILKQLTVERDGKKFHKFFVQPTSEDYLRPIGKHPGVIYVSPAESEFVASPTLSYRSLYVKNTHEPALPPFQLKASVDTYEKAGTLTAHRLVTSQEVRRSIQNGIALDHFNLALEKSRIKVFRETAGLNLDADSFTDLLPQPIGQIVREVPKELIDGKQKYFTFAALVSPQRKEGPLLLSLWKASGKSPEAFIHDEIVGGYLRIQKTLILKGLSPQLNQQNLYIITDPDLKPTGYLGLKDMEGIYPNPVDVLKNPKLQKAFQSLHPSELHYDLGLYYGLDSYFNEFRTRVLTPILNEFKKSVPGFSQKTSANILEALDKKVIDSFSAHYRVTFPPSVRPPLDNVKIATMEDALLSHYQVDATRAKPVVVDQNLAEFLDEKSAQGELIEVQPNANAEGNWKRFKAYESNFATTLVDDRNRIVAIAPKPSKEVSARFSPIVDPLVRSAPKTADPVIVTLSGATGSGKSTVRKLIPESNWFGGRKFVVVDPDELRLQLPSYLKMKAAGVSDQIAIERSMGDLYEVSMRTVRESLSSGRSVILDQSSRTAEIIKSIYSEFPQLKKTHIHVDVPLNIARDRILTRFAETGRNVPEKVLRQTHAGSRKSVKELESFADDILYVENSGPQPILKKAFQNGNKYIVNRELKTILESEKISPTFLRCDPIGRIRGALGFSPKAIDSDF
jgi:predicted ABC-type ATPase